MCGPLTLTVDAIGDHTEKWAISNEKREKDKEGGGEKVKNGWSERDTQLTRFILTSSERNVCKHNSYFCNANSFIQFW